MRVDPDRAELQPARHPQRAADVAGPHARREAVVDPVGPGERGVLVVERLYRDDRSEDLVLHDLAVLVDVGDDRRHVPRAGAGRSPGRRC